MSSSVKTILITGVTSGIGRAIARAFAPEKVRIIGLGRDSARLEEVSSEVTSRSGTFQGFVGDLSMSSETVEVARRVRESVDRIDWMILSAGVIHAAENSGGLCPEEVAETFAINTTAPILLARELRDAMADQGGILGISSTAGLWPNAGFPIYSASKAALNAYLDACAAQGSDSDFSHLTLCPGPTNTPMRERLAGDADQHQDPETVAEVVLSMVHGTVRPGEGEVVVLRDGKTSFVRMR